MKKLSWVDKYRYQWCPSLIYCMWSGHPVGRKTYINNTMLTSSRLAPYCRVRHWCRPARPRCESGWGRASSQPPSWTPPAPTRRLLANLHTAIVIHIHFPHYNHHRHQCHHNSCHHHFTSVVDPDPLNPDTGTDPGFWWPRILKNAAEIFFKYLFLIKKIAIYLHLGHEKRRPSYRKSFEPSKENIQHFKRWNLWSVFYFSGSFLTHWIRKSFEPSKENIQHFKRWNLWSVFYFSG